ncbi:hypothetical protein MNBD_GAMMA09-2972 [hydrothermal vent metagenome]|uniref:Uncharacterized protein n=1 Tax=hydrothermal vent metagenome TaxID=652676 RepID=A0A3B0XU75_9ZZZZ
MENFILSTRLKGIHTQGRMTYMLKTTASLLPFVISLSITNIAFASAPPSSNNINQDYEDCIERIIKNAPNSCSVTEDCPKQRIITHFEKETNNFSCLSQYAKRLMTYNHKLQLRNQENTG